MKGEFHLTTEAETKVLQLQAEECQGLLINIPEARKKQGKIPLHKFQRDHGHANTLRVDF